MLSLIPLISFGFIPLAVVFELNTNELTLLIISAAPIFSIGLAEDLVIMSPKVRRCVGYFQLTFYLSSSSLGIKYRLLCFDSVF